MTQGQASASFTVKTAEERPFSKVTNAPKLVKGSFVLAYAGDLEGEGTLGELRLYLTDRIATVYGLERFIGTVAGRTGTFVFQHFGKLENGTLSSKRSVIPGSGTGQLKALRGEIDFVSTPDNEQPVLFRYAFE